MKVLFTCQPGHGHLRPLVPLALSLVDQGHEVRVASAPSFVGEISATGLEPLSAGLDWLLADVDRRFPGLRGKEDLLRKVFCTETVEPMAADLVSSVEEWSPDLIVREPWELGGAVAALRLGVSCVVHGIGTRLNYTQVLEIGAARLARAVPRRRSAMTDAQCFAGHLYLDPCPTFLQTAGTPLAPAQAIRPVTCDWNGPVKSLPRRAAGLPRIAITLGTVMHRRPNAMQSLLDALAGLDAELLVAAGPDPRELHLPAGSTGLIEEHFPFAPILPTCDLIICHGGWGTTVAAISSGLPIICLPLGADGEINAARCSEAGFAVRVDPRRVRTGDLRRAVDRLLSDGEAERRALKRAQSHLRAMPSPGHVAEILPRMVAVRSGS